jgi:hypothetical protein
MPCQYRYMAVSIAKSAYGVLSCESDEVWGGVRNMYDPAPSSPHNSAHA